MLNDCSRARLLDEDGLWCFDRMRLEHKVAPNGCMVDLMARVGRLDGRARSSGAC